MQEVLLTDEDIIEPTFSAGALEDSLGPPSRV